MRLPVRSATDANLAAAFGAPGCPVCSELARADAAWLESILAESVNDVAFRASLERARGLCGAHARAVLDADRRLAGSLGAAILLRATLGVRLREIDAAHGSRGRARSRRAEQAARPPECPGCAQGATTLDLVSGAIARLAAGAEWSAAVGEAPFCMEHLARLLRERPASAGWAAAEERQVARLHALDELLAGFAHTSSHDRRHLQTDAQRASVDAAADLLGGRYRVR